MKTALTIAGSDPTGGAGLQADLAMFRAFGVSGTSIVSVVTAQNTEGVCSIHALPPDVVAVQMASLLNDLKPDALKTGMLYTAENARIVSEHIQSFSLNNLVIDPVTVSSTGVPLAEQGMTDAFIQYLFPLSTVITPNSNEAAALSGMNIHDDKDLREAAVRLQGLGPETVIITGGHKDTSSSTVVDLLFDGKEFMLLESERIKGEYHGTGCAFSAAITACLALGYTVQEAFVEAKAVLDKAVRNARSPGKGLKLLHFER